MKPRTSRPVRAVGKLFLRLGVTSALITWLFYRTDWHHFWSIAHAGRPVWLVLAFGTHFIGMGLSVVRWRLLLQAVAIPLPWSAALWALMKGAFYNTFLPTAIGGDVVRIHQVSQWTRRLGATATTVVVERWMGLVAMLLLLGLGLFSAIGPVIVPVFLLSVASVGLPVVGYAAVYKLGQRLRRHAPWDRLFRKLQTVHDALMTYRRDRLTMLRALAWSIAIQLDVVLYYWLIGQAFRVPTSFLGFAVLVPLVQVASLVPISLWGLGLREAVFFQVAPFFGMLSEQGFIVSLVASVMGMLFNMLGLPMALGSYPSAETLPADADRPRPWALEVPEKRDGVME
ncbi:hypothetical protein HRbin11_01907 [bacterium HR11]|nr:hypothetical protein HRbin11_01907 [bacterium HR11]